MELLQRRRDWNAEQLAEELDVTPRTVRRDIGRCGSSATLSRPCWSPSGTWWPILPPTPALPREP
ncbi:HTH domain-containing protein [Psychromicrobium silvestre]|uniref:HTH domain-containing protein n=1 Tax=Psychromicrobium silvestre TaxID=1645614 RepID=UPI003CCE5231